MNNLGLRRFLASAVVAATLGSPGGDAVAVVYGSAFDPPNFKGTATFSVTQACLNVGTGFADPDTLAGCDVTWLGATVTFQDAPGVTFDYSAFLPDTDAVDLIWVQNGELAGVISDAIGAVILTGPFAGPWWIQYAFAPPPGAPITPADGPPARGQFGLGVVYLYTEICDGRACGRNPDPAEVAQVEYFRRIAQIPEPSTLALTLGALGAAWFARRRKNFAA